MFFTKWFDRLERDRQQLYRITNHVLSLKDELLALEDTINDADKKINDVKFEMTRRANFQKVQIDELYKSLEVIANELTEIKENKTLTHLTMKKDIDKVSDDVTKLTERISVLEKNYNKN